MKQHLPTWKEVVTRLGMHPSGVQAHGWSLSEVPEMEVLVNFLEAKSYIRPRWPQEKAQIASNMLHELRTLRVSNVNPEPFEVLGVQNENLKHAPESKQGKTRGVNWRFCLLFTLACVPTGASVQNMYHVAVQVGEGWLSALLFTALLSTSALGFVLAGVRSKLTAFLAVFLVLYEAFCNLCRVYARLMPGGLPSEFTGQVTDVFGSGSHGTAIALSVITASIIAAVQYAAIWEINKTKQ